MASGSGLEIRYTLGSGAQRRVTYSPQRLTLGLLLACIGAGAAVLWSPATADKAWSHVDKLPRALTDLLAWSDFKTTTAQQQTVETTQAASQATQAAVDQAPLKLSGVHLADASKDAPSEVKLPENKQLAVQQLDAAQVTDAKSPQKDAAAEPLVDIVPLRLWKTSPGDVSAGEDPKAFWSIRVGLHNRTSSRLSGTVAITLGGQTSPAISFKMARYVEKELTIPALKIDGNETEILDTKRMYESLKSSHFVLTGSNSKPLGLVQYPAALPRTQGGAEPAPAARNAP